MSETEKNFASTVFIVDGEKVDANGEKVKGSKASEADTDAPTDSKPAARK